MCQAESKQPEQAGELRARIWADSGTGRRDSTVPGTKATKREKGDAGGGWVGHPCCPRRLLGGGDIGQPGSSPRGRAGQQLLTWSPAQAPPRLRYR